MTHALVRNDAIFCFSGQMDAFVPLGDPGRGRTCPHEPYGTPPPGGARRSDRPPPTTATLPTQDPKVGKGVMRELMGLQDEPIEGMRVVGVERLDQALEAI